MNAGDVVEKVHRRMLSGVRPQFVTLTDAYTANGSTLTVSGPYAGAIQPGTRLGVDLEVFLCESAASNSGTVTVVPGYEGSTPANHAQGAVVEINPRFSRFDVLSAVNDDLADLSSPINGLGKIVYIDITYNPVYQGYDLGPSFNATSSRVLEASYKLVPPNRTYPLIRKGRVLRNQSDTQTFPNGNALIIYEQGYPGLPIHVQFLAPFTPLVNLTDDLTGVAGLPSSMYDLPALGAEILLNQPREIKRNFTESQPDPRKAPEIPPSAVGNSTKWLEGQRQKRIDAEYMRIFDAYPMSGKFF